MSGSETQCMALIQAMACGLPAIGANARALPEFISDDRGMLVDEGDSEALAAKIAILFRDRSTCSRLGAGAACYARQFASDKIASSWERTYMDILDNK